jgi:hypothetical protein
MLVLTQTSCGGFQALSPEVPFDSYVTKMYYLKDFFLQEIFTDANLKQNNLWLEAVSVLHIHEPHKIVH